MGLLEGFNKVLFKNEGSQPRPTGPPPAPLTPFSLLEGQRGAVSEALVKIHLSFTTFRKINNNDIELVWTNKQAEKTYRELQELMNFLTLKISHNHSLRKQSEDKI